MMAPASSPDTTFVKALLSRDELQQLLSMPQTAAGLRYGWRETLDTGPKLGLCC